MRSRGSTGAAPFPDSPAPHLRSGAVRNPDTHLVAQVLETGYCHLPGEARDAVGIDDLNSLTVLFGGLVDYGMSRWAFRVGTTSGLQRAPTSV